MTVPSISETSTEVSSTSKHRRESKSKSMTAPAYEELIEANEKFNSAKTDKEKRITIISAISRLLTSLGTSIVTHAHYYALAATIITTSIAIGLF